MELNKYDDERSFQFQGLSGDNDRDFSVKSNIDYPQYDQDESETDHKVIGGFSNRNPPSRTTSGPS